MIFFMTLNFISIYFCESKTQKLPVDWFVLALLCPIKLDRQNELLEKKMYESSKGNRIIHSKYPQYLQIFNIFRIHNVHRKDGVNIHLITSE